MQSPKVPSKQEVCDMMGISLQRPELIATEAGPSLRTGLNYTNPGLVKCGPGHPSQAWRWQPGECSTLRRGEQL